jgi:hypothetical protein
MQLSSVQMDQLSPQINEETHQILSDQKQQETEEETEQSQSQAQPSPPPQQVSRFISALDLHGLETTRIVKKANL